MDIGDWIFLAQTVIVLVTGVVIYFYTRETRRLRKSSERLQKIAAKSALLASYNEYLSVLEHQNSAWMSARQPISHDTSSLRKKIDLLERELDSLTSIE